MKRYALLRLEHNANMVIFECHAVSVANAAGIFNNTFTSDTPLFNEHGYAKVSDTVSLCVAEYFEPFLQ